MSSTPNVLEGAKAALATAEKKFPSSMASSIVKPKEATPAKSDYSHAREVRKMESPKEFMGISSGQAPELNTALAARDEAKKGLAQQ
jgi:hypothetical protein